MPLGLRDWPLAESLIHSSAAGLAIASLRIACAFAIYYFSWLLEVIWPPLSFRHIAAELDGHKSHQRHWFNGSTAPRHRIASSAPAAIFSSIFVISAWRLLIIAEESTIYRLLSIATGHTSLSANISSGIGSAHKMHGYSERLDSHKGLSSYDII